ncbi:MAG: hypothetical protein JJU05_09050 [Verrucomicrobia bacterium]|nr:hypothetical protein [Verrucomicrobiota bacterium]MCH8527643.1 hypothetical protein [Kiritimatiellia bacterium]
MKYLTNLEDLFDWIAFDKSDLSGMLLSQAWKAENGLSGGVAKTAFSEGCLFVFADLPDEDIFNPVTEFNQRAFTEGDVFEIFLQVEGAEEYYEFHVSPTNQKFQLHFQRKREGEGLEAFDAALIEEPIESEVRLFPEAKRWEVYARIPLSRIGVGDAGDRPLVLKGSFCRYDYTRSPEGGTALELYSTSPHKKLSFHRRQEWCGLIGFKSVSR